jgi:hypothetical protein
MVLTPVEGDAAHYLMSMLTKVLHERGPDESAAADDDDLQFPACTFAVS